MVAREFGQNKNLPGRLVAWRGLAPAAARPKAMRPGDHLSITSGPHIGT
jgi:hypothetical protein